MNPLHELQDKLLAQREKDGLNFTDIAKENELEYDEVRLLIQGAQRRRSHRMRQELMSARQPLQKYERAETAQERATRIIGDFCANVGRDFMGRDYPYDTV